MRIISSNSPWSIVAHPELVVTSVGVVVGESAADEVRFAPNELRVVSVLGGEWAAKLVQTDFLEPGVDARLEVALLLVQGRCAPHQAQVLAHDEALQVTVLVVLKVALVGPVLRLDGQLLVPLHLHHVLRSWLAIHPAHGHGLTQAVVRLQHIGNVLLCDS